jgi:two-component system chemotaxis response regulator CheY
MILLSNVLIVDDSNAVRKFIGYLLKSKYPDCHVVEAETGLRALEALPKAKFDLLVIDINMPEMNGLELIRFVKLNPVYKNVPIIIVTTEGGAEDKKKGLAIGANAYLVKPLNPSALFETISQIGDW